MSVLTAANFAPAVEGVNVVWEFLGRPAPYEPHTRYRCPACGLFLVVLSGEGQLWCCALPMERVLEAPQYPGLEGV